MKKSYVKPRVCFEDFHLSDSIAAQCPNHVVGPTEYMCGIEYTGVILFLDEMQVCTKKIKDGEDGYCYHNPDDTQNLFNSI